MSEKKFHIHCPYCTQEYYGKSPDEVMPKLHSHWTGILLMTDFHKKRNEHLSLLKKFSRESLGHYNKVKLFLLELVEESK